jgi:hypothetical protein
MKQVTWKLLLTVSAMAAAVEDARSIARRERWPWYERWVENSLPFGNACKQAAAELHAPLPDVRRAALAGLLETYYEAKRNMEAERRHESPAPAAPPAPRKWRRASSFKAAMAEAPDEPAPGGGLMEKPGRARTKKH